MFYDIRKERIEKEKAEQKLNKELAEIEKAANAAYGRDLSSGVAKPFVTTTVTATGKTESFREYRPPAPDEQQAPEEASKNLIAFYNKKYGRERDAESGPEPLKSFKVGTNGWGQYSEDKKYYRAAIIKVQPRTKEDGKDFEDFEDPNEYVVRYTDYGNEEVLQREDFTTEEPALWMKPPETGSEAPAADAPLAAGSDAAPAVGAPGQWSTVESSQGVWASNEQKLKQVVKKRKKDMLSRGEKYSGGSKFLGFSGFAQEVDANDYGLADEDEKEKAPKDDDNGEPSDAGKSKAAVKVSFKKRGKKRKNRNIRSATGLK